MSPIFVPGRMVLDNGTRAAAIAGVSPTLDYRFAREKREIETVSLTDKLTYTGGNGTFVGSDGFIQRATTNVPRFDHDPLSRQSLGLLSEVERTNLLLQSNQFNTTWTAANLIISRSNEITPGGIADGWLLRDTVDASPETHNLVQTISVTAGATYSWSAIGKAGTLSRLVFLWPGQQFGVASGPTFDFSSGSLVAEGSNSTSTITQIANGWYLGVSTNTCQTSGNATLRFRTATTAGSYQGDGTGTILLTRAQAEAASTPSTYIPTTSAAVTRTADSAVIDGTGVLTGTYTMVEKPAGCAVVSGSNIELQPGFTAERVMVFPAALDAGQITAIRGAM